MNTKDLLALSESFMSKPKIDDSKPSSPRPAVKDDLANVKVSDDFRNEIMAFAGAVNEACDTKPEKPKKKPVKAKLSEAEVLQKRLKTLMSELKSLLGEAATVIQEITFTGCLGTAQEKALMLKKNGEEYPPKPKKPKKVK